MLDILDKLISYLCRIVLLGFFLVLLFGLVQLSYSMITELLR